MEAYTASLLLEKLAGSINRLNDTMADKFDDLNALIDTLNTSVQSLVAVLEGEEVELDEEDPFGPDDEDEDEDDLEGVDEDLADTSIHDTY